MTLLPLIFVFVVLPLSLMALCNVVPWKMANPFKEAE